jgi:NAD(P)-dependent dehydrogenase (short-subunit alcohol dehydrogenase family)
MRADEPRVAVVTGASRGLGREVALALAARGDRVALVARSERDLRETALLAAETGGEAAVLPLDVTQPAHVGRLAADVEERFGPVSILVNAAGIFGPIQLVRDGDPEAWIRTLSVNLLGPYLTCRAFAGGMIERGWGRIINFSSAAALHPPGPINSAYGTSKVALNQLTRHLAAELAGSGVTANVIHPGDVKTEMWADIRDQVRGMGPEAEGYRRWVQWVEETGGDPPRKAADLVLRLTGDEAGTLNGRFLWIEDGLQPPVPSWEPPPDERPWR